MVFLFCDNCLDGADRQYRRSICQKTTEPVAEEKHISWLNEDRCIRQKQMMSANNEPASPAKYQQQPRRRDREQDKWKRQQQQTTHRLIHKHEEHTQQCSAVRLQRLAQKQLRLTFASASVFRSSMPRTVKCFEVSMAPFHGRSTTTLAKYWTRPYGWSSNDAGKYIGRRSVNGQLWEPGDNVLSDNNNAFIHSDIHSDRLPKSDQKVLQLDILCTKLIFFYCRLNKYSTSLCYVHW